VQFYNRDRAIAAPRFVYRSSDRFAEVHERPVVDALERRLLARPVCAVATSEPVARRLHDHGATVARSTRCSTRR
jgi:hypothetical protein